LPNPFKPLLQTAALVTSGLLLMAVMGTLLPAILYDTHTELLIVQIARARMLSGLKTLKP
jgi:hypothetical protein